MHVETFLLKINLHHESEVTYRILKLIFRTINQQLQSGKLTTK